MSLKDPLTFATGGDALDRAAHLRPESAGMLRRDDARLLPQWQDKPLIDISRPEPALGWIAPAREVLDTCTEAPVFLGLVDGQPRFTADVSALDEEAAQAAFGADTKFIDLRAIAGQITKPEANIVAAAKGVIGWHRIHPFCARCGAASAPEDGGWRRKCTACGGLHFPRTDPVVIMLIVRDDKLLLGRQQVWPRGLYSLLAGFMEPGETIEDAVRREVFEETAIRVGPAGFITSQPWPFPASLMLGCWGVALDEEITIDDEIEDARWLSRAETDMALSGEHPQFASPRQDSIARWIMTAWIEGEIEVPAAHD